MGGQFIQQVTNGNLYKACKIMELFIGIVIIVALIVGFMYANDISERKSYEEMRQDLGEKMSKEDDGD